MIPLCRACMRGWTFRLRFEWCAHAHRHLCIHIYCLFKRILLSEINFEATKQKKNRFSVDCCALIGLLFAPTACNSVSGIRQMPSLHRSACGMCKCAARFAKYSKLFPMLLINKICFIFFLFCFALCLLELLAGGHCYRRYTCSVHRLFLSLNRSLYFSAPHINWN